MQFLEDLSKNNNKEWFHANRNRYEESRDKFLFITEVLINEIRKFDPEISALNPKDCMFRIFRDVRFSKDKTPYKTNFGSFIAKGGRKSSNPGYYIHLEPGQCFTAGGIYMPPAEPLKAVRNYISENAPEFLEITENSDFKKIFAEMYDHQLKTAPKGFPKDHKYIHLLRYKSYIFSTNLKDEIITGENFIEHTMNAFSQLQKLNVFLYKGVNNM